MIEGVRGDLILIPANMIDLGAIALPAFGYVSWPADPFDIGATRVADPKLDAELIGTAQRAAVLDTSFDMPVTVLKKPGANVSIIEVETNPIRIGRAHMRGAYDGKKHRYQNTLHSLNVARH